MNLRQHGEEQLKKDYDFLKELEDELRCESDFRQRKKLEAAIEKTKQKIHERQREIDSISSKQDKNDSCYLDSLIKQAELFQVDPDKLEVPKNALDNFPIVIKKKKDIELKIKEHLLKEKKNIKFRIEQELESGLSTAKKIDLFATANKLDIQTVESFFFGRKLEYDNFIDICSKLQLEWHDLIDSMNLQPVFLRVRPDKRDIVNAALNKFHLVIKEKNFIVDKIRKDIDSKEKNIDEQIKKAQSEALTLHNKIKLFAEHICLPLQPILQFFSGKPIKRDIFTNICLQLSIEWTLILDIDFVKILVLRVPQLRSKYYAKVQEQCETIRILDVSRPIRLNELYVEVNILDEPSSYIRLDESVLPQIYNSETGKFNRLGLGSVRQGRVEGFEAVESHHKLMVLGKPGSGKSTFLQNIAIQCNQGGFQADRVPIFLRLKNFAEDTNCFSLLQYIKQEFSRCNVTDEKLVEAILNHGRALILLDGLDEVSEKDDERVTKQVRQFCENYYKNQFVITCRIAAYQYNFHGFTDVEIADFNQKQIEEFVKNWFATVYVNSKKYGEGNYNNFIEKLNSPKNSQIRELAVSPILLTLACLFFPSKDDFPSNRSELYEEGLRILLNKWDDIRDIKRQDKIYREFSLERRIDLLSHIADNMFEKNLYFFKQSEIQKCIADYLYSSSNTQHYQGNLQLDSEVVLKSIETQHGLLVERARGIYSFSHLTFQEYFAAKALLVRIDTPSFKQQVIYLVKKTWREVFLLATEKMGSADYLLQLIKKQIDDILRCDKTLQQLLNWVNQKSNSVKTSYKPSSIRAFYLTLAIFLNSNFSFTLDLVYELEPDFNLGPDLSINNVSRRALALDFLLVNSIAKHEHDLSLAYSLASSLEPTLEIALKNIRNQLPDIDSNIVNFTLMWDESGMEWIEELRSIVIEHRNIGYDLQLNEQQQESLKYYYESNKLLLECLNSDCKVSTFVRQEIEENLLLQQIEIS